MRAIPAVGEGPRAAAVATAWLIVVTGAVRIGLAAAGHLCYGEAYYSAYVRRPALSYFDHPPLPFWLGSLAVAVAGAVSALAVRLPFVLLFAGTTWLLFVTGRRLWGPWAGFHAALLANAAPAFSIRAGYWLGPDGPLMFCSLATTWLLIPLLLDDAPAGLPDGARRLGRWAAAGAMLGLGLLSKYSVALLVPGCLLHVLLTPGRRRVLREPGPWLALGVATLVFAPVLAWNARHGWISFLWQGRRGIDYEGLRIDWLAWNVFGQSLELGPWLWVALVAELLVILGGWRRATPPRRFLACLAAPSIVAFTAVASYAPIGNHFYWGMAGYLLLLLPLGDRVHRALLRGSRAARWWEVASVAAGLVLMAAPLAHMMTGWARQVPGPIGRALATGDPTRECLDYRELRQALGARGLLGRPGLFLFTDRWYQSGMVEWGIGAALPVLCLSPDDPRGWAILAPSEPWVGHEGILVSPRVRTEAGAILRYGSYCSHMVALDPVVISRGGRPEITLHLFRCERLLRPFPRPYG